MRLAKNLVIVKEKFGDGHLIIVKFSNNLSRSHDAQAFNLNLVRSVHFCKHQMHIVDIHRRQYKGRRSHPSCNIHH